MNGPLTRIGTFNPARGGLVEEKKKLTNKDSDE